MAELGDFLVSGDSKVHVDIEMLDYGYIEKCSDAHKLRAIVDILKSGKEGFYPDLLEKAEAKLLSVLPAKERSSILRMKVKATPLEIQQAGAELNVWQESVEAIDHELRNMSSPPKRGKNLPPVRGTTREKLDIPKSKSSASHAESKEDSKKTERLSGYNFPAWEKFDVDAAINEIDEKENEAEKEKRMHREKGIRQAEELAKKRAIRHQQELDVFREQMKTSTMTDVQKKARAVREKLKGNEAFRAGENDEAYAFYSRSLALDGDSAVVYTNRAVLAIRMEKLETAVDDATRAIKIDPSYTKAYYRRGVARLKLGQTGEAILDFQEALRKDPSNKELFALLTKAKAKYLEVEGHEFGSAPHKSVTNAKKEDITTMVAVKVVSSVDGLLLPRSQPVIVIGGGALQEVQDDETELSGFTRIQIQDTDSEEDEEDEAKVEEGFTRIAITTSDDDEEEEDNHDSNPLVTAASDAAAATAPDSKTQEQFTRIAISMDSDSESDSEDESAAAALKREEEAVALKNEGNLAMQRGDFAGAIAAYAASLEKSSQRENSTAVYCNRSLTHIKMENYVDAIKDAGVVLDRDPNNLKALYRRSMAYEATRQFDKALEDLDRLLLNDRNNEAALQAKERINQVEVELTASLAPTPVAATETTTEDNVEWEVESCRRTAQKYLQNGESAKASSELEKALRIAESGSVDKQSLSTLRHMLATAYAAMDDNENALRVYADLLASDGQNHKATLKTAETYLRMGNLEEARKYASILLRLDIMDAEARVLMDSIERAKERLDAPEQKTPSPAVSPTKPASVALNGSTSPANDKESESIRFKNSGNDAMKENDYARAIEMYSKAIEIDPFNMMFFNNRAQAFLKMSNFAAAEADSTTVIDANKKLPNLKALFRRALARKGLGSKQNLIAAQEDLSIILKAEPSNKEAVKEKQRVANLLAAVLAEEAEAITRVASLPVAQDSTVTEGLVARTTRIKTPVKVGPEEISASSGGILSSASASSPAASSGATTPSSGGKKNQTSVKKVVVQNPIVPSEPPKTVYELERVWRGLKNRPDLFADYLKTFKKSTYKKVVKETCSPDLVSSMLQSVRDHLIRVDTITAFGVLEGLASTPNFGMTVSLLPSTDIECVTACIEHLTEHVDRSRGQKLKEAYKI